jgi:hypothetical protein
LGSLDEATVGPVLVMTALIVVAALIIAVIMPANPGTP